MPHVYAQKLLAPTGRWAIMARLDENAPWTQVESILGDNPAIALVDELQSSAERRLDYIESSEGDEWGDDAPDPDPNAKPGA